MKFLVMVSSLISVFLFSCGVSKPLPEHHVTYDEISKKDFIDEKNNLNVVQVYNSNLQFQEKEYNGKLYLKRTGKEGYKLAYTTDSDFKLFAFEITDSSINWEYCFTKLNNKIIKNILERDFRSLLVLLPLDGPALVSREESPHGIIGSEKLKIYAYWTDNTRKDIYKSMMVTHRETLVIVHYLNFQNGNPQRIKLVDYKSNLAMTLIKVN